MTMNSEEAPKKTSSSQLVVLNRAFKLAEQWVNSMSNSSDDAKPNEVVLESRPPRLGIGAAVPRQSQTILSNDPVERKLRAKLDAEKRKMLKSSKVSGSVDEESEDEDSESKTKAFTKKRPSSLPSPLCMQKRKVN